MSKSKTRKQTEDTENALSSAFSKSLMIAAIVGIGSAFALLGLFGVTDVLPPGETAQAYWRDGRFNLPISVLMATLAPAVLFAFCAICLKRWQQKLWPFSLALIGLICPLVWVHGLVILDIIKFDGELETGNLYLPPYPVFWSCAFLIAALLCVGAILAKVRGLMSR